MILVSGYIDVDPAQRDTFIAAVKVVQAKTREEPGNEHYVFSADVENDGRFIVNERWADEDSIKSHTASPHMAEFLGAIGGVVRGAELMKYSGATAEKLM